MTAPITCPWCDGAKTVHALVNRGAQGCAMEQIPCITCYGSGAISEKYARAIEDGQRRRAERIERGESLREMAKRTGESVGRLSELETGRWAEDALNPEPAP